MCRFTFSEVLFSVKSGFFTLMLTLIGFSLFGQSNCELACRSNVNISIDQDCQAEITPGMFFNYDVVGVTATVYDQFGTLIPNNIVTLDHVGQEVMVILTEPNCGNTCMSRAKIEDKIAPIIECVDMTISCGQLIEFMDPEPISCDVAEIRILSERYIDISCESEVYQQQIVRSFQAIDASGNRSEICEQTLTIEKFDLSEIVFPTNTDTTLYCGNDYPTDEAGNPRFDILGGPMLSDSSLYPDQFIECNTYVEYEDDVLAYNNCVTNVLRKWTISNWYCGQDNSRIFTQLYTIVDTVGPVFTCPEDMTISTSGNTCYGFLDLPVLEMTDECGKEISRVDINYTGGFLADTTSGRIKLAAGENVVEYIAYDECGNASSCSFNVLVVDKAQPVTICDQYTTVALSSDGTGILDAADVDDGSFDECSPVTLQIRRVVSTSCVETDNEFGDYVTFCCDDLGDGHMVELKVTDASGNYNICMAFVEVQDKLAPAILAELPDITVSCTFPYDPENLNVFGKVATQPEDRAEIVLTDERVAFDGDPYDALIVDNCTSVVSDEITSESINQCGIGYLVRTIVTSNPEGQAVSIQQKISFANNDPFVEDSIVWPLDYYPTGTCSPGDLSPESLPAGYDQPVFTEDGCDMVGVSYEDEIITNTPNGGGCFKIIRTWYISDWCQKIDNKFPVWEHTQYIEIENDVAPTIDSGCEDVMVCVYDDECGPGYIELGVTGSDDCVVAENLVWKYEIDYYSDGSVDSVGHTNNIAGEFAVGVHTVKWTLSDGCGNFETCTQEFEIRNCKTPTPYCLHGLSADLTPMDMDNDGNVDTEMLRITPDYFDAGSSHVCGYDVLLSFSADVNDTVRIFDCSHIGEQEIEIWVTDVVNGNQDYCTTYLLVQDNNAVDFCDGAQLTFDVTGKVQTEKEEGISEVSIILEGSEYNADTDENGNYAFNNLPQGAVFNVKALKNNEPMNGVSTLDLIIIQKHILGLQNLENDYKLIAADINNSGGVTAADLIQLRKMILGQYDDFPENSSWRFLDAASPMMNIGNPWTLGLHEQYEIGGLNSNMEINFVGVKVGDVNASASMSSSPKAQIRSNIGLELVMDEMMLEKGGVYNLDLKVNENVNLTGYQLALNINPDYAQIVGINNLPAASEFDYIGNRNLDQGIITAMYADANVFELSEGSSVFSVQVQALENVTVSDLVSIDNNTIAAESYDERQEEKGISLEFREEGNAKTSELNQNNPNPWSTSTFISFNLAKAGNGTIKVFDVTGKLVYTVKDYFNTGKHTIEIGKDDIQGNGVYYYELTTEDFRAIKKMIISQ